MGEPLEAEVDRFVSGEGSSVQVGWENLATKGRALSVEGRRFSDFVPIMDEVIEMMLEAKVVNYGEDGSFTLASGGFPFSPKVSWGQDTVAFKRREDAVGYARAFGKYSLISVDLYEVIGGGALSLVERGVNKKPISS